MDPLSESYSLVWKLTPTVALEAAAKASGRGSAASSAAKGLPVGSDGRGGAELRTSSQVPSGEPKTAVESRSTAAHAAMRFAFERGRSLKTSLQAPACAEGGS
jgi:hypothetical protein